MTPDQVATKVRDENGDSGDNDYDEEKFRRRRSRPSTRALGHDHVGDTLELEEAIQVFWCVCDIWFIIKKMFLSP